MSTMRSTKFYLMRALLLLAVFASLGLAAPARAAFLEPEQAFPFSARVIDAKTIEVKYGIADGYYLYRERFKFALDPATSGGAALGEPVLPKGEFKFDETFQKNVEHYRHEVAVRIPVQGASGPITLLSTSQGCADAGLCYPPQVARASLNLTTAGSPSNPSGGVASVAPANVSSATNASSAFDDSSRIDRTLKSGNLAWIALLFIGLGLLLAFTPCMLPMLPILSAIVVGQSRTQSGTPSNGKTTRGAGFVLALAYSLGLALVYTLLGIAAGLAGEGLAAMLQTPWVLGTFALLLVVLSLSMFGFYELQVPAGVQARLAQWSGSVGAPRGGGSQRLGAARLAGVFAMGAISALIVGPCIAAPLAGTLLYISQTRDVLIGGLALFSLAVGMSVPLLLIGLSAGSLLPRAGAWMETVKQFFGVLLLAVALWMITPVVPSWLVMLGWAALAIVSAMYLRVFDAIAPGVADDRRGIARLARGLGVLLLLAGTVEFVGLATGGRDVLQPLAHLARAPEGRGEGAVASAAPRFEIVKSSADLDRRIASAGRPVMLDFYADWCVSCKEMERYTYTDARVASRMQGFLLLKADVTANDAADREMLKRFHLFGPPGIVFFDRDGKMIADSAVIGFQDADRFLQSLARVGPADDVRSIAPQAAMR